MGGSASKAARTPAVKSRPAWAGATSDSVQAAARARPNLATGKASEIKDDFIIQDSQDPQLLRQLSQIGPVHVGPKDMPFGKSTQMSNILRSRRISDEQAEEPMMNRLGVSALSDALNERKTAASQSDLQRIATEFNMDVDVLTRLARFVNAPTVGAIENRQIKDADDTGIPKMRAMWTDAPVDVRPSVVK